MEMQNLKQKLWNPYFAGLALGGVLTLSYITLGAGLGASGGVTRVAAGLENIILPNHTQQSSYFGTFGESPLSYYLVFMLLGTLLGGFISALLAKRFSPQVEGGKTIGNRKRLLIALIGGVLVGYSSRLAQGCTSGQALSGGALLLTGSFIFLITLFASGYLFKYFFRRQWL